jgi:hypothetical protein
MRNRTSPASSSSIPTVRTAGTPPGSRTPSNSRRVALEKNHIGWAMWDYQTNFGVVTKTNGITTPDVDVLNALGLHAPQ